MGETFTKSLGITEVEGGTMEVFFYIETSMGCGKPHADMIKLVTTCSASGRQKVQRMRPEAFRKLQTMDTQAPLKK